MIVQFSTYLYDVDKNCKSMVAMFQWIKQFINAERQTKFFVLNWFTYGLALIITTVYCYARLDYVRSYRTPPVKTESQAPVKNP